VAYDYDMPCYHPLKAWSIGDGVPKKTLVFKDPGGGDKINIPCGHCIGCRKENARQWAVRCTHEAQMHIDNCFLTLTYAPEHLPKGDTLVKQDLVKFIKRLRDKLNYKKIRYFACGEYGDNGDRPHYHILLFGHDFADKQAWKYENDGTPRYFISKELEKLWGKGFCIIAPVTFETAQYVAGYVIKKRGRRFLESKQRFVQVVDYETGELITHALKYYQRYNPVTGEIWEVEPEYVTMSRGNAQTGPNGIGIEWIEKFGSDYLIDGTVHIQGRKQGSTRYYDAILERDYAERFAEIKAQREEFAKENQEEYTRERLEQKEKCAKARLDRLSRNLNLKVD
jgi:hypothetical protein